MSIPSFPTTIPVSTSSVKASFAHRFIASASAKSSRVFPELPCGSLLIALRALYSMVNISCRR